jgi:hypothetical protein
VLYPLLLQPSLQLLALFLLELHVQTRCNVLVELNVLPVTLCKSHPAENTMRLATTTLSAPLIFASMDSVMASSPRLFGSSPCRLRARPQVFPHLSSWRLVLRVLLPLLQPLLSQLLGPFLSELNVRLLSSVPLVPNAMPATLCSSSNAASSTPHAQATRNAQPTLA